MARRNKWRSAVTSFCGGEGQPDKTIAAGLQINFKTVALWRARFRSQGTDCLWEVAAGRGRKPHYSDEKIKAIINATLQTRPQEPRTGVAEPWPSNKASARTRLIACGRVISSNPTFRKLSNYLRMRSFWRSMIDVVGLYLNPPKPGVVRG